MAGPVNGHLYAQVDKAFKKKVRSMSLDSGARSRGGDHLNFFENRANTLNRRNAYGFKNKDSVDSGLNKPDLHYTNGTMEQASRDGVNSEVKSIEKLFEVCEVAGIECKVIHLIRDIRPLVMSSQKVVFFKEIDSLERPSMRQFVYSRCEMTEMNLNLVKEFDPSLRRHVTLVRFEDLAVEPLKVLDYLYEFAGLEVLENITNWVVKITQPSLKDLKAEERNPVSVVRDSFEVLNKWRLVADPCYVHVIERYCRDVMKLMGYIATEGSVEKLRNLEIPLFTEIYQAQNWVNK